MSFATTKAFALPLLATLALAGTAVAYADPVIANGNFSGPVNGYTYQPSTVAGWTFTGGTGVQADGSAWGFTPAPGGSGQSGFLQSYTGTQNVDKGSPSQISQDVTGLTAGDKYTVSFDLEQRPGYGLNPVTVEIGGTTFYAVTPASNSSWTLYSATFTATTGTEDLVFSVSDYGHGSYDYDSGLADVSIADGLSTGGTPLTPTPEPGTLLLLGTGLLGFAGLARRKFGTRNV